ncbi:MAG TPA: shikimate dehydrogenase [Gammaproteobacteria bacterium]|nr:shikimate dehydrogenase [Gammaproteobacteria bacterium]
MSKYAVLGNPVSHSKSPLIHSVFAKQTNQEMSYTAIPLEEGDFDGFVKSFFAEGGAGLNVTVPFKENAFAIAASLSPRAQLAKAVNTLFLDDQGNICGDNTDGIGLVTDIKQNNGIDLIGQRLLILGAGGAVRGALAALVYEQVATITVVNRTLAKAETLADEFASMTEIETLSYEALQDTANHGRRFDIIINGTSSSLQGEMPQLDGSLLDSGCCCYDLMYAASDTPFVQWAKQQGAALSIDGLGMLVEQAAEAFALWRGVRPNTAPVIAELRGQA